MSRPAILGPWRCMNLDCGFSQVGVSVSTVMNPLISRHFCARSTVSCKRFSSEWLRKFCISHFFELEIYIPHFHTLYSSLHIPHCTSPHSSLCIPHVPHFAVLNCTIPHSSFLLNFEDTICVFFNSGIFLLPADLYAHLRRQPYSRWKYKMMKKATSI